MGSGAGRNVAHTLDAAAAKKLRWRQVRPGQVRRAQGSVLRHNSKESLNKLCKPVLHYFDISGRGELSKLIAAVGGVEIEVVEYPFKANGASAADKAKAGAMESEHTKAAKEMGMEGCGLPILEHGTLKINQSAAVQDYMVSISPKYPPVNPMQKAKDDMFEGALEDAMGLGAGIILSGYDSSLMVPFMEKTLTHLTKYIPAAGFVNG